MRMPTVTRRPVIARARAGVADVAIGQRLRTLRASRGMTQEELAHLLGLSCQQLQKYEGGENRVSAARAVEIARHLGVSVGSLLAGSEAESSEIPKSDKPDPSEMVELLKLFSTIQDPEARKRLIDLARFFAR
ncbi:MAG: helix-turn-helix domain-containing protein [Hyphomicrobiaceae bacterium]